MAGITYMAQFTTAQTATMSKNVSFEKFVEYISRKTAEAKEDILNHNFDLPKQLAIQESILKQDFTKYLQYMNEYKNTVNLFSADEDVITKEGRERIKEVFTQSQKNEGVLWQQVFSFDNDFLKEYGLMTGEYIDEEKLRMATRSAIGELLHQENMQSSVWAASIHHNTDNLHIHVAIVDPDQQREKILYKGELQEKGSMRMKSLRMAKSSFANSVMSFQKEHNRINELIRNAITANINTSKLKLSETIKEKYTEVYKSLPNNLRLVRYNNNAMTSQRPNLDTITQNFINTYHKADYKELLDNLDKLDKKYKTVYGASSQAGYKENKLKDLFTRCGNKILTVMREDKKTERVLSSDKSSMYHEDSKDENKDTKFTERRWDLIENQLQRSITEDLNIELEVQQEEVKKEEQIKKLDIDREMNI